MLTRVEVRNDKGDLLVLPFQDVSNGFIVEDIEGLDPVKAAITSSGFAQIDGEQYQSSKREKRNIIINLALEPDFALNTVQGLRNTLYSYFMPKSNVQLRFFSTEHTTVEIRGWVESFDSPKFTRDPIASISILALDPDFRTPELNFLNGYTIGHTLEETFVYEGTVETGFVFKISPNRPVTDLTIFHRPPNESLKSLVYHTANPLTTGDTLIISTQVGDKYARRSRGGVHTSELYGITPQSSWPALYPGSNKFRVFTEGVPIPYSIEYYMKFGGL